MAENEVAPVKIGHLYYPRNVPADRLNGLAQRVGPTRFSPSAFGFNLDSAGLGSWRPDEIARCFRPAPEIGSDWVTPGSSVRRRIMSAVETLITVQHLGDSEFRSSFFPEAFFDSFQPAPLFVPWDPNATRIQQNRTRLLGAIDTYAARDAEDDFTEALDLNDTIQATIEAHTNHPKCVAVESARTALENAIETYDALPGDEGGIVNASPVVLAVDALIEACRAAR